MKTGRPRTGFGKEISCRVCGKAVYRHPSTINRALCSHACRDAENKAKRVNVAEGTAKCSKCREWKPIGEFVKGRFGRPHSHCKPCNSQWFAERSKTPTERRIPYRPAFKLAPEQKKANKREANRRQHLMRRAAGKAPHRFDIGRMLCRQDARCIYCSVLLSDGYHIDHKMPASRGGTNDIKNLQLLCPRCNMKKGAMTHEEFLVSKKRQLPRRAMTLEALEQ